MHNPTVVIMITFQLYKLLLSIYQMLIGSGGYLVCHNI